ncbi:LemA family protein [Litoribrevibacter euphylliae]|uniref:RING-type E3 ubiquitin transferase n=1 Tax=Litoribrevibacter euphylliae TaxID=1834034 RepID=A0ABV7H8M5_9GAMM
MTIKERLLTQVLPLILGVFAFWCGWKLMHFGFEEIQALRQLERTPTVSLNSLIPGPNAVSGFVEQAPDGQLVKSYHTRTPSVYYRYTHEVEKRDSDGNTYWDLVDSKTKRVEFLIRDHSKAVLVNPNTYTDSIDWSVEQSFQTITGDHRYTEYRIEPNKKIFIYGHAQASSADSSKMTLEFPPSNDYTPIISTYDKSYEQQRMGSAGVFYLWGGLALIAMSIYALAVIMRVHKVWKYQTLLITCVSIVLVHFSLLMMNNDLKQAIERYQQQWTFTMDRLANINQGDRSVSQNLLTQANVSFEDEHLNNQLTEYKVNLALSQYLVESQLTRFPEWLFAPMWGHNLDDSQSVQLNATLQGQLEKRINQQADSKLTSGWHYFFFFLGLSLMALFSYLGFRRIKFKRLIENIPTQKTLGLVPGMSEVQGSIQLPEKTQSLKSPMTSSECCWYHYLVKEKRGTGKDAKWVTVVDDLQYMDFECEDEEGRVKIVPVDAEIITSHSNSRTSGNRSYSEKLLKLNDPLYAIGEAKPDPNQQDKLHITEAGSKLPFILSNLSESKVMFRKAWVGLLFLNLAFTGIFSSGLLWFAQSGSFSPSDFLLAALVGPVYMFFFTMMLHYNDIIFLRQRAERNWVNMGVAIRKRKNLIPSLETLVKEFMKHERDIMSEVASFRSAIQEVHEDKDSLEQCLGATHKIKQSVNAVVENYPDLKSQELVSKLMDELTRLDTELALLKNGYNDSVTLYNERLETFPDILFTWLFKFQRQELFA